MNAALVMDVERASETGTNRTDGGYQFRHNLTEGLALIKRQSETREERNRLRRARRSYGLFCFADFLLIFLLYSIYLSMGKGDDQTYGDIFSDEFLHYSFKKSFIDILFLSLFRDIILFLIYIVLKLRHWIFAGGLAIFSTIFLAVKVFVCPLSDSDTLISYLIIIAAFIMGWVSTYLIDFQFKLTSDPGTLMQSTEDALGENVQNVQQIQNGIQPYARNPRVDQWVRESLPTAPSVYKSVDSKSGEGSLDENSSHNSQELFTPDAVQTEAPEFRRKNAEPSLSNDTMQSAVSKAREVLNFALEQLVPENLEWKLEDSGAYGTAVYSAELTRESKKLRFLKMEMVLGVSPSALDLLLMQFSPERQNWDDTIDSFLLVKKLNQSDFVISLKFADLARKKSEQVEATEMVVCSRISSDGSIHRYGMPSGVASILENSSAVSPTASTSNVSLIGYSVHPVASSKDKSELVYFVGMKKQGFFASSNSLKTHIQFLLTLADCLMAKTKVMARGSRTSERSYEASIEYDNVVFDSSN